MEAYKPHDPFLVYHSTSNSGCKDLPPLLGLPSILLRKWRRKVSEGRMGEAAFWHLPNTKLKAQKIRNSVNF